MVTTVTRAQFLRGDWRDSTAVVRPPWALPEQDFVDSCETCGKCTQACPERIIRPHRGLPEVDFRLGACTFCGACVDACPSGALVRPELPDGAEPALPWTHKARIGNSCLTHQGVACAACVDHCETRALSIRLQTAGRTSVHVDNERCNGCGACIPVCPADAVDVND